MGLSIWGITFRDCPDGVTDFSENPFKYAMELIYFAREYGFVSKVPQNAIATYYSIALQRRNVVSRC